jgi:hypothetical protein
MMAIIGFDNCYHADQGYVSVSENGKPVLEVISRNVIHATKIAAFVMEELKK